MAVLDIHHVSINVDDLAAAERFYVGVLGLEVLPRPDFGIGGRWLAAGGRQVHLIELGAVPDDIGQHFAFHVDELETLRASLIDEGFDVSDINTIEGISQQCFTHDPCGNRVELNQPVSQG